ncbi:hypothetical protein BH09BAC1_BH09BAC1_16930 [soil metagenome]
MANFFNSAKHTTMHFASKPIFYIAILATVFLFGACGSYYQRNLAFQNAFTMGQMEQALKQLENKKAKKDRVKVLYYLNKGVVAQMLGDYETSKQALLAADRMVEDYQKNYGLEALTFLSNPNIIPYQAEDFESVLMHYFQAKNFLSLGDYEGAVVEVRRINLQLNHINDIRKKRITYQRDAFALAMMGMIYEADGQHNDAFIAYRNAYEVYKEDYSKNYGVNVPAQLKQDLLRMAYKMKLSEDLAQYEKEFNQQYQPPANKETGDLVFFWQNGLGPVKAEWALSFTVIPGEGGAITLKNEELDLIIPFPAYNIGKEEKQGLLNTRIVRVVVPKFVERVPVYRSANLIFSGQKYPLNMGEDINAIAIQNLRDRILREVGEAVVRTALKLAASEAARTKNEGLGLAMNIASAISERADTRNWQTLPHDIFYTRLSLPPGTHNLTLQTIEPSGNVREQPITVDIRKGKTAFVTYSSLETVNKPLEGMWGN